MRDFEPRLALDGGETGLDFYRRIVPEAGAFLKPGGSLVLEIGCDQAPALRRLGKESGLYENTRVIKDLAGLDRVVVFKKK